MSVVILCFTQVSHILRLHGRILKSDQCEWHENYVENPRAISLSMPQLSAKLV